MPSTARRSPFNENLPFFLLFGPLLSSLLLFQVVTKLSSQRAYGEYINGRTHHKSKPMFFSCISLQSFCRSERFFSAPLHKMKIKCALALPWKSWWIKLPLRSSSCPSWMCDLHLTLKFNRTGTSKAHIGCWGLATLLWFFKHYGFCQFRFRKHNLWGYPLILQFWK